MSKITYLQTEIHGLDVPADQVLEGAKGKLSGALVIGFTNDKDVYVACSYDAPEALWMMEKAKQFLLSNS